MKCNHLSSRTMERYRQLGIADEVRAAGMPGDHPHDIAFLTSMTGIEFARVVLANADGRRSGHPVGVDADWATAEGPHRVNQKFLEPILQRHALQKDRITALTRSTCIEVGQDGTGVWAVVEGDNGERRTVRGSYLIGADGGRSLVRKTMGASFHGDAVLQQVQSTCIFAPELYDRLQGEKAWCYYTFNPQRAGHVFTIDGRGTFLVHNYMHGDETPDVVDRDASIRAILGVDESFTWVEVSKEDWIARRLVADKLQEGRVFIAGDAAHLWVPYGGYGLNAGTADVLNLTWALGAVISGWADPELLTAYQEERLPITEQVSKHAMAHQQKVAAGMIPATIEDDGPAGESARAELGRLAYELNVQQFAAAGLNYDYSYDASPLISYDGESAPDYAMGTYTPSTAPGCRAPHFWLTDGRSLYDAFGQGYSLIAFDEVDRIRPVLDTAAAAGVPIAVVTADPAVAPAEYQHHYVLVREDQHVIWRGDTAADNVSAFVARLRGAA